MLTPNKWFRANYAENLRQIVRDRSKLHLLIDFGHSRRLFPDADTFPAAVLLEPVPTAVANAELALYVRAHDPDRDRHSLNVLIRDHAVRIRHLQLRPDRWQLEDAAASDLLNRLMAFGKPLAETLEAPILSGLKTGFNDAYYVDSVTRTLLIQADPNSEGLFRKFLRGRNVKRWIPRWDGQWHIVIPSSQNRVWPWSNGYTESEAEAVFKRTYPAIYSHLKAFENALRARQDRGEFWWELRSCDYYREFEEPKIVVQCIAYYSQFACDKEGHYVNNKVIVIPTDDLYILAILNSRVIWWIVNRVFQHMKDEGLSVDVHFLKALPVPQIGSAARSKIEAVVRQLLAIAAATPHFVPARASLEHQLNTLVNEAFGLSASEAVVLESSLPPRDPIDTIADLEREMLKESPIKIPIEPRVPFRNANLYGQAVLLEMLLQSEFELPWPRLRQAVRMLTKCHRAELSVVAENLLGSESERWKKEAVDFFPDTKLRSILEGCYQSGILRARMDAAYYVVVLEEAAQNESFPHVRVDAYLALAVAAGLAPDAEPQTPEDSKILQTMTGR